MKRFWLTALALSATFATSSFAEISGKVTFDGTAPERKPITAIAQDPVCAKLHKTPVLEEIIVVSKDGGLMNAVVSLKGDLKGDAPADEVVIDQVGCQYVPHVVSVTVGQKLVAQNSDSFLHNVHTLPEDNKPKNMAQVVKGQKDALPAAVPETFKVKCDVHPWMSAWVAIFPHPYHSVTIEDGSFYIDTKGLKDGDYEVIVWHEKFKECATGKVTVKGGKGTIDFKVKPKTAAMLPAAEEKTALVAADAKLVCEKCVATKEVVLRK